MRTRCLTDETQAEGGLRNARLYDRLERTLIALEYALADARTLERVGVVQEFDRASRSHEALQSAGEEMQDILLALKAAALERAAMQTRQWS